MLHNKKTKNIPKEWSRKKLGELFDITSSKRVFRDEWKTNGVPFYRAREIVKLSENGTVDNELFITREMYNSYKEKYGVPRKNDLLVTGVGTVGVLYRVKDTKEFYFKDGNIIWFKNKNLVSSEFIEQLFKTRLIKKQILGASPITTVATYTIDTAKNTIVFLPPLPEQKQIVKILEIWDKCLEKLSRKIEVKKNIKKGIASQIMNCELLIVNGKKVYAPKVRLSGFSGEWESVKLGDIGEIITGNTPPMADKENYGDQYCWATAEDFNGKYINNTNIKLSEKGKKLSRFLPAGSILVTCIASIGKNAIANISLATNQQINSIVVNDKNNNEFIYYLINNSINLLKRYAGAGAMPILNKVTFSKIKVIIPELKEQIAIAKILTTADKEIEVLEKKKKVIEEQKKFLLNNLVTGNIIVNC